MIVVTAGAVGGVASGFARAPGGARSRAGTRVYIALAGCSGHAYEPARVVFACADGNVYATGLRYSSYDGREAKASGLIHTNECTPSCASGHFRTSAGTVRFYRVVRCADRRRYFSRTHYQVAKGAYSADIEPFNCAASRGAAAP